MKALIVVDCQNDFMLGGALAVTDGDKIIPVVNELLNQYELVIFTMDWHPTNHLGFASQHKNGKPFDVVVTYKDSGNITEILWPDHCVQETYGAALHTDIKFENCKKAQFFIFKKGEDPNLQGYSAFETKELASFLDGKNVTDVDICGLATDYCVANTALDAVKEGFNVSVILGACRGISDDLNPTMEKFKANNIQII